jgi:hypothetical protein
MHLFVYVNIWFQYYDKSRRDSESMRDGMSNIPPMRIQSVLFLGGIFGVSEFVLIQLTQ